MKLTPRIIAVLLLVISGLAVAESETQKIAEIGGEITIDSDGKVKAISLANVTDSKVEEFFIGKIKSWKFYPVEVNGKPVEATSKFRFDLIFTYLSDKKFKQMEFANITFEPSTIESELQKNIQIYKVQSFASYPIEAAKENVQAKVNVAIDVSADGKIRNAEIFSMELINNDGRGNKYFSNLFSKSALKAVKKMEYTKDYLVSHGCISGCIRLYNINYNSPSRTIWRSYVRVPVAPIPWAVAAELKNIGDAEQSRLVRLKQDPNEKPIDTGT